MMIFRVILSLICILSIFILKTPVVQAEEIVIDAVIASVDGVPVTLKDLERRVNALGGTQKYHNINISQIKSDPFLKAAADQMVNENLLQAEAEKRKIKVTDNDVERYIDQVAAQNQLSRSDFENALLQQGQNINNFAMQAKSEVLRGKIMGQLAQSAPAVTEDELNVDEEETVAPSEGLRLKLREIFLPKGSDLEEKTDKVKEMLAEEQDFATIATEYSSGHTAAQGGDLGFIAEADLSDQIKEAVVDLDPREYSDPVEFEDGVRFFFVESRLEEGESESSEGSKDMLRKELESRKLARHFEQFFTVDIYKNHKIEKKYQ